MERIRFGEIREVVKSTDGGIPSEIAFYGRGDRLIGWYAYGAYDPGLPYKGPIRKVCVAWTYKP